MKITIICVGKLKEKYFTDAVDEYSKRLRPYIQLNIVEVPDEKKPDRLSVREAELIKQKEAERIIRALDEGSYKIALAIEGSQTTSEGLEKMISQLAVNGNSRFTFIIGGSLGLSQLILGQCEFLLSFSKLTFPHQLMRVILLEQIYRVFKIRGGEPYHR